MKRKKTGTGHVELNNIQYDFGVAGKNNSDPSLGLQRMHNIEFISTEGSKAISKNQTQW